jgi:hypothetical protein
LPTTIPIFKNFSILLYIILHATVDVGHFFMLCVLNTFSCRVYWALFAKLKLIHKHDEMKTKKRQVSTCSLYLVHWEGRGNEFEQYTWKMSIKFSCLINQICPIFQKCFNLDILSGLQKQWYKTTHTSLNTVFIPSFYSFLDSTSYCNRMTLVLTHSYSYPLIKP